MKSAMVGMLVLGLTVSLSAQQSGDADRNYLVNNQGSFDASPVASTVVNSAFVNTMGNVYTTSDAQAPVAWITATEGQIGWIDTGFNSIDIGPAGLSILLDGLNPANPLAPFLVTDPNGNYSFSFVVPQALYGSQSYFAMLHATPSSPDGFRISQTHLVSFDPANNLVASSYVSPPNSATTVTLGDDDSIFVNIGFTFEFYGTSYTQCYINSNGNITFGSSDSDFTESVSDLATGPRRVAAWWDDLSPNQWGTVAYESDTDAFSSDFTVWWSNIAEFGPTGLNSFSARLHTSNIVIIGTQDYDVYVDIGSMDSSDGLVGISPGASLFGTPTTALDLSAGPHTLAENATAYYELFSLTTNPSDVEGQQIHFDLEDNGYPSSQT